MVWGPEPHDVDYGDPEKSPVVKAWKARKLKPPNVGEKWILWMRPVGAVLTLREQGRQSWSEVNLAKTRAQIERDTNLRKEQELRKDGSAVPNVRQSPAKPADKMGQSY